MKVGYVCTRTKVEDVYTRTKVTPYFCNYLMKQGAEEVIVDNGNHELLSGLLSRLQPGDSFYVLGFDHLSINLNKLKEILETLHQKGILLFLNGSYIDFDDPHMQRELKYYFQDAREHAKNMLACLEDMKALREQRKKEKAGG